VSDNCTATGSLVITQSPAAGSVVNDKGSMIVAFTVRDASGNESTCTITVDKKDVTDPVISCPAPITVNNTANTCGAVVNFINPTATDNCTGGAFNFWSVNEPNNYQGFNEDYVQLYNNGTWNDLPNSSLNRWIVEFNDIRSNVYSGYTWIGTHGGHTYYYSSSSATWTNARAAAQSIGGDLASINTLAESTFLAPYGGNTWVGGYQDKTVPGFQEPGNASQNYLGWKWVDGTQLGAGQIVITQTAGLPSGSVFPVGVTTNTFIARDESGNESTCSFTVTVLDAQPPVINCPANISVTATSAAGAVVNYTTPVGTDNCSGATTERTAGLASGSTFPIGTTTVTYRVTDAAGLSTQCSFTVTIVGVAPVISCPANITLNAAAGTCAANVNFAATETVGIPASTITYTINGNPVASGASFPVGTTTVVATATNAVGSSSCSFTVTVVDNQNPAITAPENVQANNTAGLCTGTVALGTPVTSDNCGVASFTNDAPITGIFPVGSTTVIWIVTDIHGNKTTATQTVVIVDNEKPTISVTNVNLNNDAGKCGASVAIAQPETDDNCGVATVAGVRSDHASLSADYPIGTTTITWTVRDVNGNHASTTQTIVVTDNEKPTISVTNVNLNNDAGKCGASVAIAQPETDDNCGVATVAGVRSDNQLLTADYPVGTTTITWTVRDVHGNTNSVVQTIVVTDNEKPVINCAANQVFCANTGGNTQYVIPVLNQSDNCGISSTTYVVTGVTNRNGSGTNASGSFAIGTSIVIYTVTDIHGNISTCSFTVTINPLPVAGINVQSPDVLCNQFTLIGTSTLNGPFGYQWLYNNSPKASTPQLSLGLTDADGVYTLFVTDGNGCRSEMGAAYNYQKQDLSSSYTLLANKEVKLSHYNTVASGSVGIMTNKGEADFKKYTSVNGAGSFVKAPKIDADKGSILNSKIYGVATVTLPTMQYNTNSSKHLRDISVNQNSTVTLTGNYDDVTIKKGANATLVGTVFGKVRLEEGASVKFTSAVVNMEELQIDRGPKSGGYSYVRFTQSTSVRVNGKVSIGNDVIVNPEAYVVTFYMGDKCDDGENFHVKGDDTRITANIYIPNGKIKVTGGNYGGHSSHGKFGHGNDDDDDDKDRCDHRSHSAKDCKHKGHGHHDCNHQSHHESDCRDYVYMTGLFIAEEIHSEGKYVIWNNFSCSASSIPTTAVTSSNNTAIASDETVKTNALTVVTSDEELKVTVMPNPSSTYFTVKLESKYDAPVYMRVVDALGRVVDNRVKLGSNATVQVGHNYQSGTYFAEFIQGNRRKVVQLLKVKR
ncbi:MAG: HYR domain-containing protein, partial [Sediminibacterium sp.]